MQPHLSNKIRQSLYMYVSLHVLRSLKSKIHFLMICAHFFLLVWRVRSEYFGCFILFWSLLKHVLYLGVWKFELNNLIDKTVFFVSLASLIACYVWLYLSGIGSVVVWFFVLIYMYMYIHLPFLIDNQWNFAVCCYFTRTIRTIDWRENSRRITKVCLLTLFFPSYSVLLWEANIC